MFAMTPLRMLLRDHYVPFFAAWLLLFVGTAWPCPPACHVCTVRIVQCEHISSLQGVLGGLSSHTMKIVLLYGNLTEIPPLSFAKFPRLHFLSITGSPISSLSDFAFFSMQLNSLRVLNLSNNHLFSCTIEPMAFTGLPFLQELILANNSLDLVRQFWFLEMPGLLRLHLGANQIAYLPPRAFQNLTKLTELVVSSNLIQYLSMDTFYGVPLLTRLDLSNNRILFIHHEVFQPLKALKHLILFRNRLTVLPILPSSIRFLFLHENPWLCTCQLVSSMVPFLEKIQSPDGVTCDGPPSLAGQQVTGTKPEGCSSRSLAQSSSSFLSAFSSSSSSSSSTATTSTHVAPTTFWNLSVLYGFLGGILTSLVICLLCCCCLFCRFRQYWNFTRFAYKTESKATHQGKTAQPLSSEKKPSDTKPQVLRSFPVVQNTAVSMDPGCVARRTFSGCQAEPTGCPSLKPLIAELSTDAESQRVVSLHEEGQEAGSPVLEQSHCQLYRGNNREHEATACQQKVDHVVAPSNCHSSEQQSSAKTNQGCCDHYLQQAASSQAEKQHCAVEKTDDGQASHPAIQPGGLQCPQVLVHINVPNRSAQKIERHRDFSALEKSVNGQASHCEIQPGGLQCPQVLVHINVPDESAQKIERHQDWIYEASVKRTETKQSRFPFHPSHRWLSIRKSSASIWRPSHHHLTCFASPRSKKTSHMEGLLARRHPKHMVKRTQATWKSDLYADVSLLASKVNMRQERTSQHCHCHCSSPSSTTLYASSISSTSTLTEENGPKRPNIEYRMRERSSRQLDDVSQARKMHPEHQKIWSLQDNSAVTLTRDSCLTERYYKCPKCGCGHPSPLSIAQGMWAPWDPDPRTSKGMLDVASQQSSTETIHLKDREMALACLGLDENTEKSPLQERWPSLALPALPLPVSQHQRRENESESAYEDVSLPTMSSMQLRLNNEAKRMTILEVEETRNVGHHHSVDASSMRDATLGGEIPDAEGSVDANSLGQRLREGEKALLANEFSNTLLSESSKGHLFRIEAHLSMKEASISSKSCRAMLDLDPQGDVCEEMDTTTTTRKTSWCPEVQKIQIQLPFLMEEEKPSD